MGRIHKKHTERRNEILGAAMQLFSDKGYDKTSVQDILNKVGVAKGTFYHYFKSKEELLDQLVEKLTDHVMLEVDKVVNDTALSAVEKLNRVMSVSRRVKSGYPDIIKAIVGLAMNDGNIRIRHKMRERNRSVMIPLYWKIIEQGMAEGSMDVPGAEEAAVLLAGITLETGDRNTYLLATIRNHPENMDAILRAFELLEIAVPRILKMPEESFTLLDREFTENFLNELSS